MVTRDDYPDFSEVIDALAHGPSDVADETPPPSLWDAIDAELQADVASDPDESAPPVASLSDRRSRRSRRAEYTAMVVGIAAALLLVGVPLGLALRSNDSGDRSEAVLAALAGYEGDGWAERDDRLLTVEASGLDPVEGSFYELWLLKFDNGELIDLVSLGTIDEGGTYTIDESIDVDEFDVVDISIEADDGNPDHSGASVLRGDLI